MAKKENILIIGSGAAGINFIQTIRKYNRSLKIELVSKDSFPYSKTLLINYISNKIKDTSYKPSEFFRENNVVFHPCTEVTGIDENKNTVYTLPFTVSSTTNSKKYYGKIKKINYDYLIIATGAEPVIPQGWMRWTNLKGIFTLTTLQDAQKIKKYLKNINTLVILGGGLIGCELADALSEHKKIILIENQRHILSNSLDETAAKIIQEKMKSKITIFLNTTIKRVYGNGKVKLVETSDGLKLNCEAVVICIGVKPNIELLKNTKIKAKKGIIVDDKMKTSIENIYAVGDVTESFDFVHQEYRTNAMWVNALKQAEIAALSILNIESDFKGTTNINTSTICGLSFFSVGKFYGDEEKIFYSPKRNRYEKFVFENGSFVGYISLNSDLKHTGRIAQLIGKNISLEGIKTPQEIQLWT